MYDVVIIGAGPGGMTAAIYAARANLKVLVLEKGIHGGQMMSTSEIENYPGYDMISGMDLSEKMYEQVLSLGAEFEYVEVTDIRTLNDKHHQIVCEYDDIVYDTKTVIIGSGATPKKIGIKGEKELGGRGVSYCAICDGAFFRDKEIVVIGGGDSAVEEAVYLAKYGSKVTVFHRSDKFKAQKVLQDRLFANEKIEVKFNTQLKEILGKDKVSKVLLVENEEEKEMQTDGVFIYVGMDPITSFVPKSLLNEQNYVVTNEEMETNQKGIYAIGDVRDKKLRQIVTATGDGAMAIHSIEKFLQD